MPSEGEASTLGLSPKVSDKTLERTKKVLNILRDLQLQAVFDIGRMKVVDQQLTDLLIMNFLHLHIMLGENLLANMEFYHSRVLEASEVLEADLTGYLGDTISPSCGTTSEDLCEVLPKQLHRLLSPASGQI